jgi:hypothetical protein
MKHHFLLTLHGLAANKCAAAEFVPTKAGVTNVQDIFAKVGFENQRLGVGRWTWQRRGFQIRN